ncbi:MAG: Hpt domain-containing protein [Pseudomonadota bacterium]
MEDSQSLKVLDRSHLLAMTGNDTELAAEVLEIFREQAAVWDRLLDPTAAAQQWADAAHTLKGAALGAGALRLAKACEVAETAGRADIAPSQTAASVYLNDIKDALGAALEAVATAHHEISATGALVPSKDPYS